MYKIISCSILSQLETYIYANAKGTPLSACLIWHIYHRNYKVSMGTG